MRCERKGGIRCGSGFGSEQPDGFFLRDGEIEGKQVQMRTNGSTLSC